MTQVVFNGWAAHVSRNHYTNGRVRLDLHDPESGEPLATATVNLTDQDLAEGEVCVKDWSENRGILAALLAAGVVEPPKRWVESGHVKVPVCRIVQR